MLGWSSYWNIDLMSPLTSARKRGTPRKSQLLKGVQRKRESTEAGRYKVEQGRLSVLVDVHHKDGEEEAGEIS